jgi:DNA-binding NarL/FixJ family response regulator
VLVVDDHRTFAEALALAIRMDRSLSVHIAANGIEAVEVADRERPDVVLMDAEMPGMAGIEAIRQVRARCPDAQVVVLSAHDDDLMRARAVEAGAAGYLSKSTPVSAVPEVIRKVKRGDPILDAPERERLLRLLRHQRSLDASERHRLNRLTVRQIEILRLLATGVSTKDIAERLGVTPYTLRTHVQNVLARLGVHSKMEAVALAMRHGMLGGQI